MSLCKYKIHKYKYTKTNLYLGIIVHFSRVPSHVFSDSQDPGTSCMTSTCNMWCRSSNSLSHLRGELEFLSNSPSYNRDMQLSDFPPIPILGVFDLRQSAATLGFLSSICKNLSGNLFPGYLFTSPMVFQVNEQFFFLLRTTLHGRPPSFLHLIKR